MQDCIDTEGFRANVGIILSNAANQLFWAGRAGRRGWQFPQGGIAPGETPESAMYRELREEVGLESGDVTVLGCTDDWLRYRLPKRFVRHDTEPLCIGQKQIWYLLAMTDANPKIRFDATGKPEFDRWRWVDFWHPVESVIYFKRRVYERALRELGPLLYPDGMPPRPRNRSAQRRAGTRARDARKA